MREAEKTYYTTAELFDVIQGTADMSAWSQQEKNNFEQVHTVYVSDVGSEGSGLPITQQL